MKTASQILKEIALASTTTNPLLTMDELIIAMKRYAEQALDKAAESVDFEGITNNPFSNDPESAYGSPSRKIDKESILKVKLLLK